MVIKRRCTPYERYRNSAQSWRRPREDELERLMLNRDFGRFSYHVFRSNVKYQMAVNQKARCNEGEVLLLLIKRGDKTDRHRSR